MQRETDTQQRHQTQAGSDGTRMKKEGERRKRRRRREGKKKEGRKEGKKE